MRLTIDLAGDVQLDRTLLRYAGNAADMSDGLEQVADLFEASEAKQFASQGQYASGGWQPLADSTLQAKGGRGSILVKSGDMRDSFTGGPGSVRHVTPSLLVFGSTDPKAKFHQTGTRSMPRRRPLELTEGDRREAPRILQRHLSRRR